MHLYQSAIYETFRADYSYQIVDAASFEVLPAAYTGSIVSVAAGGAAVGSSASS